MRGLVLHYMEFHLPSYNVYNSSISNGFVVCSSSVPRSSKKRAYRNLQMCETGAIRESYCVVPL